MLYIIPVFVIIPLILMGLMIVMPTIIGKRMHPSFTKEKSKILNIPRKELYNILIDYENYPLWIRYLHNVKIENIENNKLKIIQTYKNKKDYLELTEVRRIENMENNEIFNEISIVKTENEGITLWTYMLENHKENKTKMTIKETMYIYNPYLRFMLKYILTDENGKGKFFKYIKTFVNKNNKKKNNK